MGWSRGGFALVLFGASVISCAESDVVPAAPETSLVQVVVTNQAGRRQMVAGSFADLSSAARLFNVGTESLRPVASEEDDLGVLTERFTVEKNGLPVVGADLRVHSDARGRVVAAGGIELPDSLPSQPVFESEGVAAAVLAHTPGGASAAAAELVYVAPSSGADVVLAWRSRVTGMDGELPIDDDVFVDADTGAIVDRHPRIHTARNRLTYNANNQENEGTLVRDEASAANGDPDIDAAHLAAGRTYDCLKALFARDSYDNAGASLRSVANFGQNFENAFWDGARMHYGDGFAVVDVGTHEFVHAVTEKTANLVYQNQPGALNEALSDIMSAVCDVQTRGSVAPATWTLGEALPIGTIRYMDDPAKDGISSDTAADLYTGTQDNGGVHINSGVPNLAFVLLTQGGTHPRQKTAVQVQGIGIDKAGKIAYRALTTYLGENSNFAAARTAFVMAATDLYGDNEKYSVEEAWAAVGVGNAPDRPAPAPAPVPGESSGGGQSVNADPVTGGCSSAPVTGAAWLLLACLAVTRRRRRVS